MSWTDETTGLPCHIQRNTFVTGALCGYVGVRPDHPFFGLSYADKVQASMRDGTLFDMSRADVFGMLIDALDGSAKNGFISLSNAVSVHGGLTWTGHLPVSVEGESRFWWLGFDCGHAGDVVPAMDALLKLIMPRGHMQWRSQLFRDDVYRDIAYVRQECLNLAQQLNFWLIHRDRLKTPSKLDELIKGRA